MTDNPKPEKVNAAFDLAIKNCGSKQRMLAALDITESWMYALRNGRPITIEMALKLQVLTKAEYQWKDLCPEQLENINAVSEYLIN